MAQATALILDSTDPADPGCPLSRRVLEGKRTIGRCVLPPTICTDLVGRNP